MTTKTSNRLPWLFFVGPDGVVRTSRDADQAATRLFHAPCELKAGVLSSTMPRLPGECPSG